MHNPVISYEVGDDFLKFWYLAWEGKLDPFVLVLEGSIPNEKIKSEGYWAALGTNPADRPADHDMRMDRPSGAEGAGGGRRGHVRNQWWNPRYGR